jgi:hypothetical protein
LNDRVEETQEWDSSFTDGGVEEDAGAAPVSAAPAYQRK